MAENLTSGTEPLPEIPDDPQKVMELVNWYRTYYEEIADCCMSKQLPKPPQW